MNAPMGPYEVDVERGRPVDETGALILYDENYRDPEYFVEYLADQEGE